MKTIKWMAFLALGAGISLTSCTSMDDGLNAPNETKQGELVLKLTSRTEFGDETRGLNENDYKDVNNYTVEILQGSQQYASFPYNEVPSSVKMPIGQYTLKAHYGGEVTASRDQFYVEGIKDFTIEGNQTEVIVDCYPTCGKIITNFDASMSTDFSDYYVVYQTKALKANNNASITWTKENEEPWYVKLDKEGETVKATIHAIRALDGEHITVEREYGMMPNKAWTMNVKAINGSGTLKLEIIIDNSTDEINKEIIVPSDWI